MSEMSNFPCQDLAFLETVPSVPITIGITVTLDALWILYSSFYGTDQQFEYYIHDPLQTRRENLRHFRTYVPVNYKYKRSNQIKGYFVSLFYSIKYQTLKRQTEMILTKRK